MSNIEDEVCRRMERDARKMWVEPVLPKPPPFKSRDQKSYELMIKLGVKPFGAPPDSPAGWNPFFRR